MKSKYPALVRNSREDNDGGERDVWFTLPDPAPYLQSHVDHAGTRDNSVRVFKTSPEGMTLQIRTFGPVNENRRGTPRPVYASFSGNRQNMLTLAAEIIRVAKLLPEA